MRKAIVLFDVDGTLLITGGATSRAIRAAATALFGAQLRWSKIPPGRLDHQLFCDLAINSGIADPARYLEEYKPLYLRELRRELAEHPDGVRLMPGVREIVHELAARSDVIIGLLTGNYREGVQAKLAAADLDMNQFAIGAFAADGQSRSDLVHVAVARATAHCGTPCSPAQVILVGDTPRDIECAREAGCLVLAVATGQFTLKQLLACSPNAAVKDLTVKAHLEDLISQASNENS